MKLFRDLFQSPHLIIASKNYPENTNEIKKPFYHSDVMWWQLIDKIYDWKIDSFITYYLFGWIRLLAQNQTLIIFMVKWKFNHICIHYTCMSKSGASTFVCRFQIHLMDMYTPSIRILIPQMCTVGPFPVWSRMFPNKILHTHTHTLAMKMH